MPFGETLFGCTGQGGVGPYFWTYDVDPQGWFDGTTPSVAPYYDYPSTSSNTTEADCIAGTKVPGSYNFAVLESNGGCDFADHMLWGMYHYPSGTPGYNYTSHIYVDHPSPWDGRQITYPICNGLQTSNGQFWIGVR